MESLAAVVFERTPQGAVAIKSANDEVPRRLRTLLLAVDGRSAVAQYVPFLTAFAPLSEKFAELEKLGYLRRSGGQAVPLVPSLSYESALNDLAQQSFAQMAPAVAMPADNFALELQALARQMGSPNWQNEASTPPALPAGRPPHDSARRAQSQPQPLAVAEAVSVSSPILQDLLREMEGFLSRNAGLDGLPIALMLGQITSLAQLRQELPGYRQLIQSYGGDAEAHGAHMAGRLDHAME